MLKRITFLVMVLLFLVAGPDSVSAITTEQRRVYDSGIGYFDIEAGNNGNCANTNVNLSGNDNIERVYNFFLSKGLTAQQAAGIAGNAMAESGGDPTIVSANGLYHGLFQWDTTNRWARLQEYAAANNLQATTLEAQLGFAFEEATQRGNIDGIKQQPTVELATWHWGRFYEVAIIGGSTSTTPLTNVQHLDRRTQYANEVFANYGANTPAASPGTAGSTSGACAGGNGQNTQYVDGFTVYSQYDPAWSSRPYGSSTIGESGCGPSAMAMIITALTSRPVTPVETSDYAASIGMYVAGAGSSWDVGPRLAEHWNLRYEPVAKDVVAITAALQAGKLVITPGQGAEPFTSGGHFIVIRGITADGKFKIGDSAHNNTSTQDWDPQFIVNNMRDGGSYAIYQ